MIRFRFLPRACPSRDRGTEISTGISARTALNPGLARDPGALARTPGDGVGEHRRIDVHEFLLRERFPVSGLDRPLAGILHGREGSAAEFTVAAEAPDAADEPVAEHLARDPRGTPRASETLDRSRRCSTPPGVKKRTPKRDDVLARDELLAEARDDAEREEGQIAVAVRTTSPAMLQRGNERAADRCGRAPANIRLDRLFRAGPRVAPPRESANSACGVSVRASRSESEHRDGDRHAELEEELSDDAFHEGNGQEDRDDRGGGGGGGEGDLRVPRRTRP